MVNRDFDDFLSDIGRFFHVNDFRNNDLQNVAKEEPTTVLTSSAAPPINENELLAQPSVNTSAAQTNPTESPNSALQQIAQNAANLTENELFQSNRYNQPYHEVFRFLFSFLRQSSLIKEFRSGPQERNEITQIARRALDDEAAANKMSLQGEEARHSQLIEERLRQEQFAWRLREERMRIERLPNDLEPPKVEK